MTLAESRGKQGIAAPTNTATVTVVRALLDQWRAEGEEQKSP